MHIRVFLEVASTCAFLRLLEFSIDFFAKGDTVIWLLFNKLESMSEKDFCDVISCCPMEQSARLSEEEIGLDVVHLIRRLSHIEAQGFEPRTSSI